MRSTRIVARRTAVVLVGVVTLGITVVVGSAGAADRPPSGPTEQEIDEAIRTGKAKVKPPSPTDAGFSGWWQGCRFVLARSNVVTYEIDNAWVQVVEEPTLLGPASDAAGCVPRSPTQEEIAAFQAELEVLSNSNRPAGLPEPPKRPVSPAQRPVTPPGSP